LRDRAYAIAVGAERMDADPQRSREIGIGRECPTAEFAEQIAGVSHGQIPEDATRFGVRFKDSSDRRRHRLCDMKTVGPIGSHGGDHHMRAMAAEHGFGLRPMHGCAFRGGLPAIWNRSIKLYEGKHHAGELQHRNVGCTFGDLGCRYSGVSFAKHMRDAGGAQPHRRVEYNEGAW
jgi:hypothetical protein